MLTRIGRHLAPRGSIDAIAGGRIVGWALGRGQLEVEVWLDDICVARCTPSIERPDVATAFPARPGSEASGFTIDLPSDTLVAAFVGEMKIVARQTRPWPSATLANLHIASPLVVRSLAEPPSSGIRGPFSRRVIDTVAVYWPQDCTDLTTMAGQRRFCDRLLSIMATPGLNALPAIADYARYLTDTMAHCRFVEQHFPQTNPKASAGAADFHCKPNSIRELFPSSTSSMSLNHGA